MRERRGGREGKITEGTEGGRGEELDEGTERDRGEGKFKRKYCIPEKEEDIKR